ncbi:hypothetical protein MK139_00395 [bacterium]|jgi:hypothetical protein|nr:hypothetical protein [bacterium]HCK09568.1 hypothetical protein [Candidatus Latescibacterota bacterium]
MKTLARTEPFVINKNLGSSLLVRPEDLTSVNDDGEPTVIPTDKQKYDFDRNGWILFPGLLSEDDVAEMRDFATCLHKDPESLPECDRCGMGGPLARLIDHPVVVGFLNEFLAYSACASEESYGFRLETSHLTYRSAVDNIQRRFGPHNGNGLFRPPWESHYYRQVPGRAWSGLTRVVWELNPVKMRKGGTLLISGSHKAAYPAPASAFDEDSPIWDSYECPAGSLLIFSESTSHSASRWTDEEHDRVAIFNLYNTISTRWTDWMPHPDLLAKLGLMRRSLFREVKTSGNVDGGQFNEVTSGFEGELNG